MSETISYRADAALVAFWAVICSPPALVTGYLLLRAPSHDNLAQFVWTLALPLLPVLFASRFRATFTPTEFIYRRWGPTIRVPYSDIRGVEVANVTPISKHAVGAFILTKSGNRLPFWPKLFPRRAVDQFFALGG